MRGVRKRWLALTGYRIDIVRSKVGSLRRRFL
jgi:hypothetical protein